MFSNKTLVGEENCYVMLAKWYTNVLKRVICPSCCSKGQGKKVGVFELEGSTPEMMAMMSNCQFVQNFFGPRVLLGKSPQIM